MTMRSRSFLADLQAQVLQDMMNSPSRNDSNNNLNISGTEQKSRQRSSSANGRLRSFAENANLSVPTKQDLSATFHSPLSDSSSTRKGSRSECGFVYWNDDAGAQRVLFSFTDTVDFAFTGNDESDLGPVPSSCEYCKRLIAPSRLDDHKAKCPQKKKKAVLHRLNERLPSIVRLQDGTTGLKSKGELHADQQRGSRLKGSTVVMPPIVATGKRWR
jgi:hypothetical protein